MDNNPVIHWLSVQECALLLNGTADGAAYIVLYSRGHLNPLWTAPFTAASSPENRNRLTVSSRDAPRTLQALQGVGATWQPCQTARGGTSRQNFDARSRQLCSTVPGRRVPKRADTPPTAQRGSSGKAPVSSFSFGSFHLHVIIPYLTEEVTVQKHVAVCVSELTAIAVVEYNWVHLLRLLK